MAKSKSSGIKYGDLKDYLALDGITLSLGNIDPNTEMTESTYNLLSSNSQSIDLPPPFNDKKVLDYVVRLIKGFTESSESLINGKNKKFYIIIMILLIIVLIMLIVFYLDYLNNIKIINEKYK